MFRTVNQSLMDELKVLRAATDDESAGLATTAVAVRSLRPGRRGTSRWPGPGARPHGCSTGPGEWSCLTRVDDGQDDDEFSSTAVQALPSGAGAVETEEFSLAAGAVFLVSDGMGDPLVGSGEVRQALATWWADAPDLVPVRLPGGLRPPRPYRRSHCRRDLAG